MAFVGRVRTVKGVFDSGDPARARAADACLNRREWPDLSELQARCGGLPCQWRSSGHRAVECESLLPTSANAVPLRGLRLHPD
jgi:hypothetical protein